MDKRYQTYSAFLEKKYGEKVYKLPINLPVTCPNRVEGNGGCSFCSEIGTGFEMLHSQINVKEQIAKNRVYIGGKYKANKYIAYFQNFTNTYMPLSYFKKVLEEAMEDDIVGVAISTRPDCIHGDYLECLKELSLQNGVDPYFELGLQTVNYHTLKKVNRGHGLAEFIDAVQQIRSFGFNVCAHVIVNLPWDNMDDTIETAKVLSALKVDQVKIHALYIMDNTVLGDLYKQGASEMIGKDEYIERVITFLEYLNPNIVIQRLIGRAPEENSLFVNWGMSWWKIRDEIEQLMEQRDTEQGIRFDYLAGKCIKKMEKVFLK